MPTEKPTPFLVERSRKALGPKPSRSNRQPLSPRFEDQNPPLITIAGSGRRRPRFARQRVIATHREENPAMPCRPPSRRHLLPRLFSIALLLTLRASSTFAATDAQNCQAAKQAASGDVAA